MGEAGGRDGRNLMWRRRLVEFSSSAEFVSIALDQVLRPAAGGRAQDVICTHSSSSETDGVNKTVLADLSSSGNRRDPGSWRIAQWVTSPFFASTEVLRD